MAAVAYHQGRFPPTELDWVSLLPLIGPANAAVARYDGLLHSVPNAAVLLTPLMTQEAVLSSRIEGTQATLGEVLEYEAMGEPGGTEREADYQEVLNYRAALRHAVRLLDELPLSQRLLREAHQVLLRGVRGQHRLPGEYRRVSNWIGPAGCTIETARYVPPSADQVSDAMARWELYLHEEVPDRLVQLAIAHAEIEAIHPFLDGNGRLGRLLVPLFLVVKGLLSGPSFYISAYLEAHRDEYYERLLAVSRDGDWTGWCRFFLTALHAQAEANQDKAVAILDLYQQRKDWITDLTNSSQAIRALDWFFSYPVFSTAQFTVGTQIPDATAKRILRLVKEGGMLVELRPARGRRAAIWAHTDILQITEGRPVL